MKLLFDGLKLVGLLAVLACAQASAQQKNELGWTMDSALDQLEKRGLLEKIVVEKVRNAYIFLRNLEHRLQYLDDQQTQKLPESMDDLSLIAESGELSSWETEEMKFDWRRLQRMWPMSWAPRLIESTMIARKSTLPRAMKVQWNASWAASAFSF